MSYTDDLRRVAFAHIDELRGDLDRARHLLVQTDNRSAELRQHIASLMGLIALAVGTDDIPPKPEHMPLQEAMATVLRNSPTGMMRAGDLAAVINAQHLYRMRDGRPVEAQQIHARVGHYSHLFTREGTFIRLAQQLKSRPAD